MFAAQHIEDSTEYSPFMGLALNTERREHRRHDLEEQGLAVERWDAMRQRGEVFGTIVDLSPGGVRFKTRQTNVKRDTHIRLRLKLPTFAGISPFIDHDHDHAPKTEWVGWLVVTRVMRREDGYQEVAGRLVDMDEIDRGMLGLYLSTQPMAA